MFLRHKIDGASLLLLTESHLMDKLGLKVGPAVRLRSALARRLAECPRCNHCQGCHQDGRKKAGGEEEEEEATKEDLVSVE